MKASPLACPPFDDLGGLWLCRNPVVLNKLGVFGMFPVNRDLDHNFAASRGLKRFRRDVSGLISDLTPLILFDFCSPWPVLAPYLLPRTSFSASN